MQFDRREGRRGRFRDLYRRLRRLTLLALYRAVPSRFFVRIRRLAQLWLRDNLGRPPLPTWIWDYLFPIQEPIHADALAC